MCLRTAAQCETLAQQSHAVLHIHLKKAAELAITDAHAS